jgi:NAD(P)H-dependent FMN reductase
MGIVGSLRKASFNRGLMRAAQSLAPAGMQIETFEIGEIPPYNEDVLSAGAAVQRQAHLLDGGDPEPVRYDARAASPATTGDTSAKHVLLPRQQ